MCYVEAEALVLDASEVYSWKTDQLRGTFWGKPGVGLATLSKVQTTSQSSG